jgi:hypothetical protein
MLPLLLAALQTVTVTATRPAPPDTVLPPADSVAMATAYRDDRARELVRLARTHRGVIDASVFRYTATARQRISVRLRALRRDRLVYRRETASRLEWRRDGPARVEVLGAREAVPIAVRGLRVPDDLDSWARSFLPRPGDPRLFVTPTGGGFAWHPLVEGAEALYQYATGDTTVIRLPDGGVVRLVELRVIPRRRDIRLVTGSFWIEQDQHAIVQALFRPAREFDLERDLPELEPDDAGDGDEIPRIFKPIRFDIRYIAVEYGLWEMRWWMPRVMAFDGWLQVGPARFPINMELSYSDYVVEADRHGLPELPPVTLRLAGDPTARSRTHEFPTHVAVPDTAGLISSPYLPPVFYAAGEQLISERELRVLADRLGALPPRPWELGRPRVNWPWDPGRGLLRYNRVEGLSAGVRADLDLGRARVDGLIRLGTGDLEPNVELAVERSSLRWVGRAVAYHRLAAADPAARPFGIRNSLGAFFFGQDDGLYYRATGLEVLVSPDDGPARSGLRLYVERQREAEQNTDFSLRQLVNDDHRFGPNIEAERADQWGAHLRLGVDRGLDPAGLRGGARFDVMAETGTYSFIRPGLTFLGSVPLPGGLLAAAEVAAGTTVGGGAGREPAVPVQSQWFLGGPMTLRGFPAGSLSGPDHLRARMELANRLPAARLALFSDAGWAGSFDEYQPRHTALSAGVGASFLDGLLRLDVARALRPERRWRLEMYVDALF